MTQSLMVFLLLIFFVGSMLLQAAGEWNTKGAYPMPWERKRARRRHAVR